MPALSDAVLLGALLLVVQPGFAYSPGPTGAEWRLPDAPLPDRLTRQTVRDVLSIMDDRQVRALLLDELDRMVAVREAEIAQADDRTLAVVLGDWARALAEGWASALRASPGLARAVMATVTNFQDKRGGASPWRLGGALVLCLLSGIVAHFILHRLTRRREALLNDRLPANLGSQVGTVVERFALQCMRLAAFVAAAQAVGGAVNRDVPADGSAAGHAIAAIGWTWFAALAARFVLSPKHPALRLCALDDRTAFFLTWRIALIFGFSAVCARLVHWAMEYGWPSTLEPLGFWISLVFHGLMAMTIWQARAGIAGMVRGRGGCGSAWNRFAAAWPPVAIAVVAFQWLVVELFAATGNIANLPVAALNVSIALLLALPLMERSIRALVEALWPDDPAQGQALRAAHRETQRGLIRCVRMGAVVVSMLVLAWLWGLDLHALASQGMGARLAGALVEVLLIALVAYGLWELLEILFSRQMAIERATLGVADDDEARFEGEGGRGGTRLGTVMPLVRRTGQALIAAFALLAVLGQVGVNIAPLLAGAGIVGLAVGFGAQALVKDIISGVFFLIDDAFRKGEYIDIGTVKGTVERISIRSMQLRHHNGPLHTIPFGEIRHLTNFSRDWVMMKLPLRVTYDTDLEKLRRLIKKLGQDLLQDPELGPKFLQPLKSQGVIQMEDSAMIVRVKFMTRPGDQWAARNKVFARIREMFEREGIHFAHREVTVRIADPEADRPPTEAQHRAAGAAARSAVELPAPDPPTPGDDRL